MHRLTCDGQLLLLDAARLHECSLCMLGLSLQRMHANCMLLPSASSHPSCPAPPRPVCRNARLGSSRGRGLPLRPKSLGTAASLKSPALVQQPRRAEEEDELFLPVSCPSSWGCCGGGGGGGAP